MSNSVNDNLGLRDLVENEIRVRRRRYPANNRIISAPTNPGMQQQKIDYGLDPGLDPPRALRRTGGNVIEDRLRSARAGRV